MDLKKVLELLNIDALDESKQTEIKEKIESIIEVKVNEKLTTKEKELKDELVETYEEKFETYKEEITEKFSNFVDEILEEELQIPENILEYARKGELYDDLIEQFKTRLSIDENYIDDEMKELLKETRDTIKELKTELNLKIEESLELKLENKKLEIKNYLMEKVKGLPLEDAEKVISILEDEKDINIIEKKYNTIIESILDIKKEIKEEKKEIKEEKKEIKEEKEEKGMMSYWVDSLKEELV